MSNSPFGYIAYAIEEPDGVSRPQAQYLRQLAVQVPNRNDDSIIRHHGGTDVELTCVWDIHIRWLLRGRLHQWW